MTNEKWKMENGKWKIASLLAVGGRRRLVALEIALDRVEYTVDELSCFERREAPRYFERFVYHDGLWRVLFVEEFVDGESKDVPVYDGHPLDAPVLGAPFNQLVYFVEAGDRAQREVVREIAGDIAHIIAERLPVAAGQLVNARLRNVVLKEHL